MVWGFFVSPNPFRYLTSATIPFSSSPISSFAALRARREEIRDDPTTSTGTRLNLDHEVDYRRAVMGFLLKGVTHPEYRFTRAEANASAREVSDSGRDAAYGYMARLVSHEGPVSDRDPVTQRKVPLYFKDLADYRLSPEELEAKYPKEGREK